MELARPGCQVCLLLSGRGHFPRCAPCMHRASRGCQFDGSGCQSGGVSRSFCRYPPDHCPSDAGSYQPQSSQGPRRGSQSGRPLQRTCHLRWSMLRLGVLSLALACSLGAPTFSATLRALLCQAETSSTQGGGDAPCLGDGAGGGYPCGTDTRRLTQARSAESPLVSWEAG
jgi:hypothetical protein